MKTIIATILILLSCPTTTFAGVEKCQKDVAKFCSGVTPGQGLIVACLMKNKSKVSAACIRTIEEQNQGVQDVMSHCKDDARRLCSKVEQGHTIKECLESKKRKLSSKCKSSLKKL